MARSYTTLPLTDDHGLPLINVVVEGYNASDDSLVETAYTGAAGTAAFTALPDDAEYYFIARWGNRTLRWTRDFTLPTKQFFQGVTAFYNGAASADMTMTAGAHAMAAMRAQWAKAGTTFKMPHDFNSLTAAYYVIVAQDTDAAAELTIASSYGAVGEAYNAHTESDTTSTYSITDTEIEEIDISGILTGVAADDYVGISITTRDANSVNYDVLGVMIYYQ